MHNAGFEPCTLASLSQQTSHNLPLGHRTIISSRIQMLLVWLISSIWLHEVCLYTLSPVSHSTPTPHRITLCQCPSPNIRPAKQCTPLGLPSPPLAAAKSEPDRLSVPRHWLTRGPERSAKLTPKTMQTSQNSWNREAGGGGREARAQNGAKPGQYPPPCKAISHHHLSLQETEFGYASHRGCQCGSSISPYEVSILFFLMILSFY
jgi:hypothetical protein